MDWTHFLRSPECRGEKQTFSGPTVRNAKERTRNRRCLIALTFTLQHHLGLRLPSRDSLPSPERLRITGHHQRRLVLLRYQQLLAALWPPTRIQTALHPSFQLALRTTFRSTRPLRREYCMLIPISLQPCLSHSPSGPFLSLRLPSRSLLSTTWTSMGISRRSSTFHQV